MVRREQIATGSGPTYVLAILIPNMKDLIWRRSWIPSTSRPLSTQELMGIGAYTRDNAHRDIRKQFHPSVRKPGRWERIHRRGSTRRRASEFTHLEGTNDNYDAGWSQSSLVSQDGYSVSWDTQYSNAHITANTGAC